MSVLFLSYRVLIIQSLNLIPLLIPIHDDKNWVAACEKLRDINLDADTDAEDSIKLKQKLEKLLQLCREVKKYEVVQNN